MMIIMIVIILYNDMLQVLAIHIYRNLMMNQSSICFSLFLFPRVTLQETWVASSTSFYIQQLHSSHFSYPFNIT